MCCFRTGIKLYDNLISITLEGSDQNYLEPFALFLIIGDVPTLGLLATAGANGVHSGICVTQVSP